MNQRHVAFALLALCVLALGTSAGALSTDLFPDASEDDGPGGGTGDSPAPPSVGGEVIPVSVAPWFVSLVILAFVALALPSVLALRGRHVLAGAAVVLVLGSLVALVYVLADPSNLQPPEMPSEQPPAVENGTVNGTGGSADGGGSPLSSLLPLGVVGLVLVVAVVVVHQVSAGGDVGTLASDPGVETEERDDEGTGDIARAAGRAADRLADETAPDRSNAVYEAWHEMTTAVDGPDPATATPGEFADAAVAAGMNDGDVGEITALFEAVRYGSEPPTDALERRAVEALRRIEDAHATGGDAGPDGQDVDVGSDDSGGVDATSDDPGGADE